MLLIPKAPALSVVLMVCIIGKAAALEDLPPKPAQLISLWSGYDESGAVYYSVNLGSNGLGSIVYVHGGEERVVLLAVTNWTTDKHGVDLKVTNIGQDFLGIRNVSGGASTAQLSLTVSGDRWRRSLILRRHEEAEHKASLASARRAQTASDSRTADDPDSIAGRWTGYDESRGSYFSVHLASDTLGALIYVINHGVNERVILLDITNWGFSKGRIDMTLAEVDKDIMGIKSVFGRGTQVQLDLFIAGNGWHRALTLHRHDATLRKAGLASARLAEFQRRR